ncbi:MAG: VWA domain-containing protein [Dehalococcoidia bacterium]|nr:VWA domain-containing protein [Dehalococcoidia bacterium]HRC63387.1 VWA domain-containing protein [Dehalococcoidia bacterium]
MSFGTPWLLLLLPLAALIPFWQWRRPAAHPALAVADLGVLATVARDQSSWRIRLRWLPAALRVAAIALIVVALARPQRGLAVTSIPEEGIDIVLALDVSGSMAERTQPSGGGIGPPRIEAAKDVIAQFVDTLRGDRAGFVIFQGRSLVLSPLTLDLAALKRTVHDTESGLLPDGTAIGLGLSEALNLLRDSEAHSRIVVLLTDGQNNAGDIEPVQAAQLAKALGVRVYTIGFTSRRGSGEVDETMLRRIASDTEGAYHDASTQQELAAAYDEIGALERSRVAERTFTRYEEFAPWLAAAALALLISEAALRATLLRRFP